MKNLSNKKLLLAYLILLLLNCICIVIMTLKNGANNLDGSYSEAGSTGLIISAIMGIVISIPIVGSILSALIALFINKHQPYGKRFVTLFLQTMVVVYAVTFLRFLFNILFN